MPQPHRRYADQPAEVRRLASPVTARAAVGVGASRGCERQSEVSNDEVGTTPIGKPDAKTIGFWEIAAGTAGIKMPTDCAEPERYAVDQQIACKHGADRMLCEKGLPDFDELGVVYAALPVSTRISCRR